MRPPRTRRRRPARRSATARADRTDPSLAGSARLASCLREWRSMHGIRISLSALRHNAETLRDLVGVGHAAFVVKGNAYGHGLVPVARAVEPFAARLCVYTPGEAFALRAGGIAAPIVVLGPIPPKELDDALAANLELALWSTGGFLRRLGAAARK